MSDPVDRLTCLRALDVDTLHEALANIPWLPIIDGISVRGQPLALFANFSNTFANKPLLVGSNHDEGNFFAFLLMNNSIAPISEQLYYDSQGIVV